jgi:protein-S-isoprenylcysteine O-methyltransferase Ste14
MSARAPSRWCGPGTRSGRPRADTTATARATPTLPALFLLRPGRRLCILNMKIIFNNGVFMDRFQIAFLVLLAAVCALRVRWHLRAKIHERGVAEPSEGWSAPVARLVAMPAWAALVGAWFLAPDAIGWSLVDLPDGVRWAGAGLVVAGLALLAWVHAALDTNFSPKLRIRADHTMTTHGPYRWVRHPMYTAFLMLMGGFFLLSGHLVLLVTGVGMVVAVIRLRTPREEAMLLGRFGEAYRTYMARTGALLPRWGALRDG